MVKTLRTEHLWTFTVPWRVGDARQEGIWGLVDKRSRCLTGENFDQTKVSHSSYSAVVSKVRESEIWNPGIFSRGIGNPVLWNSEYRSRNPDPTIDWNQESKFHWQKIRYPLPGIRNPWLGFQNPRLSWIPLYGANCHWIRLWPPLKMCKQLHHVYTGGHQLHWGTRMNWPIWADIAYVHPTK